MNLFDFSGMATEPERGQAGGTPSRSLDEIAGATGMNRDFSGLDALANKYGLTKTEETKPSMSFKENVGGGLIGGALGVLGAASEIGSYINPMRYFGGEDNTAKAGAEFGKSLKPAFERQAKKAGYDPESFGAKLGETAPSFLVPMGGYLGASKGAATLGRTAAEAAIGGGLMGAVAGAGESGTAEGAAKGIIPGAVGGATFGAIGHGIAKLPELLIGTGIGTPSKLLNASERLKKLGAPEYTDASAASKWLLDKGIAGNLEQRAEKLQSVIDDGMRRSSELLAKDTNLYDNQVTASIRQALREMLPNFAKVTEKGIQPKAGTEDVVNTILEIGGKEGGMTLDQINRARTFIADTANIFRTSGDMTADASKLGLQNVWKNASKFIEKTAPGFRAANKDVEVGIALKDAVALKQSQDMTRQIVTLMNAVPTAAGASYGAVNEGGVEGALKGAAAGFALKKGAEFVFSPANASRLAVFIDRFVGGQGKRIAEALKKAQEKGIAPEPEIMQKLNEALSKSASSAPVAPASNVKTKTLDVSELTPTPPVAPVAPVAKEVAKPIAPATKTATPAPAPIATKTTEAPAKPLKTLAKPVTEKPKSAPVPTNKEIIGQTEKGGVKNVAPSQQIKLNQWDYKPVRVVLSEKDKDIMEYVSKFRKLTDAPTHDKNAWNALKSDLERIKTRYGIESEKAVMERAKFIKNKAKEVRSKTDETILDLRLPPVRQSSVSAERPNRRRPGGTETTRRLTRGMEGQRPGKEVVTKQRLGERRQAREGAFQERAEAGGLRTEKPKIVSENDAGGKMELSDGSYLKFSKEWGGDFPYLIVDMVEAKTKRSWAGTNLMEKIKEYAQRNGFKKIQLWAFPQDESISPEALRKFYESQWYKIVEESTFEGKPYYDMELNVDTANVAKKTVEKIAKSEIKIGQKIKNANWVWEIVKHKGGSIYEVKFDSGTKVMNLDVAKFETVSK